MNKRLSLSTNRLYQPAKRRIFGELLKSAELTTSAAWVSIHRSSKGPLLTYESRGLVVAVAGGGKEENVSPSEVAEATILAKNVADQGGMIINGGRAEGIMKATFVPDHTLGVIFPELKSKAMTGAVLTIVNAPTPRIELLATCAPIIVIFRGGLGTFSVLMRAIIHVKNRVYHPEQLPQMVFVNDYWIGLLTTMMNLGTLPREFLSALHFFNRIDQIVAELPAAR